MDFTLICNGQCTLLLQLRSMIFGDDLFLTWIICYFIVYKFLLDSTSAQHLLFLLDVHFTCVVMVTFLMALW